MEAYIFARTNCGECRSSMALNESNMTVRCTHMKCKEFNVEYNAPKVKITKPKAAKSATTNRS